MLEFSGEVQDDLVMQLFSSIEDSLGVGDMGFDIFRTES